MATTLKDRIKGIPILYKAALRMQDITTLFKPNSKVKIFGGGILYKTKKRINGNSNIIHLGRKSIIKSSTIVINGNNNKIVVGDNCVIGKGTSILIEGDNHCLTIGHNSTFTQYVHLCLQEHNTKITLGDDCMLSNHIIIRTSDSHPMYDDSNNRINCAKDVFIGNHVWICPNVTVMKGARIGDGAIIGSGTMVTKNIPAKCLAVGFPAKVAKENIAWTRDRLW